jgi:transcriptional regulator NrdR family protein
MVCIHCGSQTRIANSRPQKRNNQIWRRRECLSCHAVFTTEESVDYTGAWTVRNTQGALEPFSRDKLFVSLIRSLEHRKTALSDAMGLTETIIQKLSGNVANGTLQTRQIVQVAQVALNRFDAAASVSYAAFHV